jgi:GAF domain-containing protein
MHCPRCQHENRQQAKFCEECGTPLTANPSGGLPQSYSEVSSTLNESLEQQTATSEILRVIASSPTDLQPVMNVVAESAARFCGAGNAAIFRVEGELLRLVAVHGPLPGHMAIGETIAATPGSPGGRAICDRRTIHIEDMLALPETEFPEQVVRARRVAVPARTVLATPLLREDVPIGVIYMRRSEVHPFTEKQIELAKTFANQAVIVIENVRLFHETKEALEQQTATSEILRVIASSPTDLQPVMEAVAENAARVCGAGDSAIFRLEGEHLRLVARHGSLRRYLTIGDTVPVSRSYVGGRAVCDRRTIHVEDIRAAEAEFPDTVSGQRRIESPTRTMLATPLLREGTPLGVIVIARGPEVHPFSAKQIALLQTFADQAVIAIENVRLFQELQTRNTELAESLEQQTATGEILRVISRSQTDVQPVFDTIADNLQRLFVAWDAWVTRYEDGLLYNVAVRAGLPEVASLRPIARPFPATPELTNGWTLRARRVGDSRRGCLD